MYLVDYIDVLTWKTSYSLNVKEKRNEISFASVRYLLDTIRVEGRWLGLRVVTPPLQLMSLDRVVPSPGLYVVLLFFGGETLVTRVCVGGERVVVGLQQTPVGVK